MKDTYYIENIIKYIKRYWYWIIGILITAITAFLFFSNDFDLLKTVKNNILFLIFANIFGFYFILRLMITRIKPSELKNKQNYDELEAIEKIVNFFKNIFKDKTSSNKKPYYKKQTTQEKNVGIYEKNIEDSMHGVNQTKAEQSSTTIKNEKIKEESSLDKFTSALSEIKQNLKNQINLANSDFERIQKSTIAFLRISTCISNGTIYSNKMLLKLKSSKQIAYAWGVCDSAALSLKLDEKRSEKFIIECFSEVYGSDEAEEYKKTYLLNQMQLLDHTKLGGQGLYDFFKGDSSNPKLMPQAH